MNKQNEDTATGCGIVFFVVAILVAIALMTGCASGSGIDAAEYQAAQQAESEAALDAMSQACARQGGVTVVNRTGSRVRRHYDERVRLAACQQ